MKKHFKSGEGLFSRFGKSRTMSSGDAAKAKETFQPLPTITCEGIDQALDFSKFPPMKTTARHVASASHMREQESTILSNDTALPLVVIQHEQSAKLPSTRTVSATIKMVSSRSDLSDRSPTQSSNSLLSGRTTAPSSDSDNASRVTSPRWSDASSLPIPDTGVKSVKSPDTPSATSFSRPAHLDITPKIPPCSDARSSAAQLMTGTAPRVVERSALPQRVDSLGGQESESDRKRALEPMQHRSNNHTHLDGKPLESSATVSQPSPSAPPSRIEARFPKQQQQASLEGSNGKPAGEIWRRRHNQYLAQLDLDQSDNPTRLAVQRSSPAGPIKLSPLSLSVGQSRSGAGFTNSRPLKRAETARDDSSQQPFTGRPARPSPCHQHSIGQMGNCFSQPSNGRSPGIREQTGPPSPPSAKLPAQQHRRPSRIVASTNKPIPAQLAVAARPPTPEYGAAELPSPNSRTIMSPASPASSPEVDRRKATTTATTSTAVEANTTGLEAAVPSSTELNQNQHVTSMPIPRTSERNVPTPAPGQLSQPEMSRINSAETMRPQGYKTTPVHSMPALTYQMAVVQAAFNGRAFDEEQALMLSAGLKEEQQIIGGEITVPVYDALPLTKAHVRCYKQHRQMRASANLWCPLACQTCGRRDMEMRWRCNWCSLRTCRLCFEILMEADCDVDILLRVLEDGLSQQQNQERQKQQQQPQQQPQQQQQQQQQQQEEEQRNAVVTNSATPTKTLAVADKARAPHQSCRPAGPCASDAQVQQTVTLY